MSTEAGTLTDTYRNQITATGRPPLHLPTLFRDAEPGDAGLLAGFFAVYQTSEIVFRFGVAAVFAPFILFLDHVKNSLTAVLLILSRVANWSCQIPRDPCGCCDSECSALRASGDLSCRT